MHTLSKGVWFLESIVKSDILTITLRKGTRGKTEYLTVAGKPFGPVTPVEWDREEQKVVITFHTTVAWQIVDESYTTYDAYEVREGSGNFCILRRSRYLDYVNQHYSLYQTISEDARATHYRVWTEDDVIDIVSCDEPTIEFSKMIHISEEVHRDA